MSTKPSQNDVNTRLGEILRSAKEKLPNILGIFLIDTDDGDSLIQYPKEESARYKEISLASGTLIQTFENNSSSIDGKLYVEEIEVKTATGLMLLGFRITDTLILCFVAEKGFPTGLARLLCQSTLKEEINTLLELMGFSKRNKYS